MVTGDELAAADRSRRPRMLRDADVVARVAPEQKLQVVEALRDAGRVVGMVGDAANDDAAVRAAGNRIARTRPATTPSPPIAAAGTEVMLVRAGLNPAGADRGRPDGPPVRQAA
ncbi:hypothetical protein [Streptomyces sp. NPDC005859]|uniref:hypothetical protein n=1 Tax=Streptomyces sp. NPDC005859 TaxID=3157170 RepID=UPI0033F6CE2F